MSLQRYIGRTCCPIHLSDEAFLLVAHQTDKERKQPGQRTVI